MKRTILFPIFFLLLFAGRSFSQTMPLYLNFNSHNEISDHIQYATPSVWTQYRGLVLAVADTFYQHGVKWNLQCESDFVLADLSNENGFSNPDDLLDSLDNSATVEVDPHNHWDTAQLSTSYNPYNYSDVAHLLDSAGLAAPRNNMGGFMYTNASDFMPYQNAVPGYVYPSSAWSPNVIWGAGSPNHTNDYNGYGVWKPQGGGVQFLSHDPLKHLTYIGNGCSEVVFDTTHVATIVNAIVQMLQYIQQQPYDPMAMYTASIQMNFRHLAGPGYVDSIAAIVRGLEPYVNSGQIVYQTLTEKYTTWYTAHTNANDYFKVDCQGLPLGVTDETQTEIAKLWPNPVAGMLNVENGDQPVESIEIFDLQGKCVLRKEPGASFYAVDVTMLSPGLYFLRQATADGKLSVTRFVKE